MSRSFARWIVCVLIAAHALATTASASARGRRQASFRLELGTGKVQALSQVVAPAPVAPWPAPVGDPRRSITSDERALVVSEPDPGDPSGRKVSWQFTVPGSGAGWNPWRVLQGHTVVYAWREEIPDQRYQYRDIARALDMDSRKLLWERVDPAHDPPGAVGVGADHLVVDQDTAVLLLETRTGRVVRRLAKTEPSFAVASPRPGRVWIEAGGVIECIDQATMTTVWRASKQGALVALQPIRGGDDWLVKTDNHTYRVRAADGRQLWSARSTSASRPVLSGDRAYEGSLVVDGSRRGAQMSVTVRDLASGKVVRDYPLGRHDGFFDQASVVAVEARDGWVDVTAEFTVLD